MSLVAKQQPLMQDEHEGGCTQSCGCMITASLGLPHALFVSMAACMQSTRLYRSLGSLVEKSITKKLAVSAKRMLPRQTELTCDQVYMQVQLGRQP
jgi:hypothetical protein